MDKQQLTKTLKTAIRSLQRALDELESDAVREEAAAYSQACSVCGKPILPTDVTKRGVHEPCYQAIYQQFIRTKLKTLAELEAAGILSAKAKSGRKPVRDLDALTKRAQRTIDGDEDV